MKQRTAVGIFMAVVALLVPRVFGPAEAQTKTIVGMEVYDASGYPDQTTQVIPKAWKLVSATVVPGEKNVRELWFQDADGAVYLVRCASMYSDSEKHWHLGFYAQVNRIGVAK